MTDKEVVKRLRWMGHENTDAGADLIEALTAKLAEAEAKLAKAVELLKEAEAEAKLAKAVEAKQLASDAGPCVCFACLEARALLAEIEGTDAP
jgi:hypothetical protein